MRKAICTLALFLFSQGSLAHGPLRTAMEEMGASFKILAVAITAGTMSEAEIDATESLQLSTANASLHYPGTANTDQLKIKYSQWMAELNKQALLLEEAIEASMLSKPQDLSEVTKIFQEINSIRIEGHGEFKTDH